MSVFKRGTISLSSGVNSYTATGLALPFTPGSVDVKIRKPTITDLNLLAFVFGAPTSDGFSVDLSGTTDKTGYVLEWTAWSSTSSLSGDSLALSYDDLKDAIRLFLGYPSTPSAGQLAEIDTYIHAGLRQFYYPPAMQGVEPGYEWSFMRPTTTIATVDGDGILDLPEDFGRLCGDLNFQPDIYRSPIVQVSEGAMQALLQRSTDEGTPAYACIRYKSEFGDHGQLQEIMFWPIPDAAYTLTYRYEAYSGKLTTDTNPYPLGGARFSEVLLESCLAVAEQRANDERGLHTAQFERLLAAAVAMDRRHGAKNFGPMGGVSEASPLREQMRSGDVTYKGVTW